MQLHAGPRKPPLFSAPWCTCSRSHYPCSQAAVGARQPACGRPPAARSPRPPSFPSFSRNADPSLLLHPRPQSALANLLVGAASGTLAASACYPLDTVRRRMQMKGHSYAGQLHAMATIWRSEGAAGFYRGWVANTLKVVPQNAIRLVSYEALKGLLGVARAKTDT